MNPNSFNISTMRGLGEMETAETLHPALTMRRIDTPVLNILLGSTPALAALEVYQHLLTHNQKDRDRVSFVYIDTDDVPLEMKDFREQHKGLFREINLRISVPPGVEYAQMPKFWTHTFVPKKIPKYFANGAGGIRNNGHVAAAFNYHRLQSAIDQGLRQIMSLGDTDDEQRVGEVQVNIVAFLGGGTGSGIVGDVAVLVRNLLTKNAFAQRINLFCLLPERIGGSTNVNISWRKSNATATLLELTALSLVAKERGLTSKESTDRGKKLYHKYMLHEEFDVTDQNALANEVYLIGRTQLGTANDTARLVGLDLYMRIVDGSGVGWLEHSKWVDRQGLTKVDDRQLPTFYGTTCPLMAEFPALSTASAFAQISAARLIPHLVPLERPQMPPAEDYQKEEWRQRWEAYGRVADDVEEGSLADAFAVYPPAIFSIQDFDITDYEWLQLKRRDYDARISQFDEIIRTTLKKFQRAEERRIDVTPVPEDGEDVPIIGLRIRHLQSLKQEYEHLQTVLQGEEIEFPSSEYGDNDLQNRISKLAEKPGWPIWLPLPLPFPGFIANPIIKRRKEDLLMVLNYNLQNHPLFQRRKLLSDILTRLASQVDYALQREYEWFDSNFLVEELNRLMRAGRGSNSWKGLLDQAHPHMFHIYDHRTLRSPSGDRNMAVERLYFQTTLQASLEEGEVAPGEPSLTDFPPTSLQGFIDGCQAHLAERGRSDREALGDRKLQADDLEEFGKKQLSERVVEFFTDYYLARFRNLNLFDLLRLGTSQGSPKLVGSIIFDHLARMKDLLGELIVQEETLYHGGPEGLEQSLYVGVNFGDNARDEFILQDRLGDLSPLTRHNLVPFIKPLDDPHQLQMCYGLHGISLSTIPEFYKDSDSMMGEFLRHQSNWMNVQVNNQLDLSSTTRWATYGVNDQPALSSGELEEMVCSPTFLSYSPSNPHTYAFGPSMVGRVIREVQTASGNGNGPRGGMGPATGNWPGGDPRAGGYGDDTSHRR